MDPPGGQPDRQREPVRHQPVGERGEHRGARADAGEHEHAVEAGLDKTQPARRDRDLGQELGRAEGEQDEAGPSMVADRGQGGEQRRVVERPARDGREQRALPARPDRGDDPVALAQEAVGQALQRVGSPPQAVADALDRSAEPAKRAVKGREQGGRDESATKIATPITAASSSPRSTPPRSSAGMASTGIAITTANVRRFAAVRPEITDGPSDAGLYEHAVLEGRADRAAAGSDPGERAAGELRGDDRVPALSLDRKSLECPQRRHRGRLRDHGATSQPGASFSTSSHEPRTSSTLGATR